MNAMRTIAAAGLVAAIAAGCGDGSTGPTPGDGGSVETPERCVVTVSLAERSAALAGNVYVDYSGTNVDAGFGPPGFTTRCRALQPSLRAVTGNYCDASCATGEMYRYLLLSFQMSATGAESALEGPIDLFRCDFHGEGDSLGSILPMWSDLMDPQGVQRDARYGIGYECSLEATTTTTTTAPSTTTTTCGDEGCEQGLLRLEVWVDDPVVLSSLDFTAKFPCAAGEFVGARDEPIGPGNKGPVRCELLSDEVDMWATNELQEWLPPDTDPGNCRRKFRLGALSLDGIHGPTPIAACEFAPGSSPVRAESFDVSAYDWTSPDGEVTPGELSLSLRGFPEPSP